MSIFQGSGAKATKEMRLELEDKYKMLIFANRAPCGSVVKYVSGQQGVDIMENSGRGI